MDINAQHYHPRDGRLTFDAESHTYSVDGRVYEPVTSVVESCFEQFDAEYWARRKATPERPAEVWLAEWEARGAESRRQGTAMHAAIESYYLGGDISTMAAQGDGTLLRFLGFAAQMQLHPYRTEWAIYDEECGIAGTLDFLDFDGMRFTVYDWKRTTKLTDQAGNVVASNPWHRTAFAPIDSVPDTVYHHYALQVSIYRYILERRYGIVATGGRLGVFHPDLPCWYVIELPYLRREVELLFAARR